MLRDLDTHTPLELLEKAHNVINALVNEGKEQMRECGRITKTGNNGCQS